MLLNAYVKNRFTGFKTKYDNSMITDETDVNALSLLWLHNLYLNDINENVKEDIITFAESKLITRDFHTNHWYKLPSFLGISYLISLKREEKDVDNSYSTSMGFCSDDFLDLLIQNMGCHQSTVRKYFIASVGLLVNRLEFSNELLRKTVLEIISKRYGYSQEAFIILLHSNGSFKEKYDWIKENQSILDALEVKVNPSSIQLKYSSDFFNRIDSEIKDYIIETIFQNDLYAYRQFNLVDDIDKNSSFPFNRKKVNPLLNISSGKFVFEPLPPFN